jgi:polysaccharide biosynthesis/export protein
MRVYRRAHGFLMAVIVGGIGCWVAGTAHAQDVMSQDSQLDILRSLTPEQRESILRDITEGGSRSSGRDREQDATRDLERSRTEQANQADRLTDEEREPVIPVLKPQDTVIVEIDFHLQERLRSEMPRSPTTPNALGATPQWPPPTTTSTNTTPQQQLTEEEQKQKQEEELQARFSPLERERLENLIKLIQSKNPYQLSREGVLTLPGFAGIPLAGLTDEQATLRLQIEPALRDLQVRVTRLPLKKFGSDALKPFGYDLFDRAPSTFAPVTNVPVPSDYVVGAGDELEIQLFGNQNRMLTLVVGRDGIVNFPGLGPINVGGQRFSSVKASIESRVERQMIGVRAAVAMGDTRSIRVFVLGEAKRAGTYTISGLGTITSALFAAGGVKPIGSLRKIQLKRQGTVVRELDLYDMLIRGDTSDDAKLLPGDAIFIPPVGHTISVDGEVRRPAIYELKDEKTYAQIVQLAGGLTPDADVRKTMLTRIDENRRRVVLQVDLISSSLPTELRNGDLLRVARLRPTLDSGVLVQGHVFTPGAVAYRDGLRLSDVISSVDELMPNADIHYLLIRRESPPDRRVTALSADLAPALRSPGSAADVLLQPRDQITVFDLESGRDRVIQPLLDELRLQSQFDRPTEVVNITGQAKVPGEYPLEPGMRISDLIRAGGSLADAAYGGKGELARYKIVNGEARRTELIEVDLSAVLKGDPTANIELAPFDSLSIKEISAWGEQEVVTLRGEVRFPGQYAIKRGETLKSVIMRAGGLTEFAFPDGSVFTREELKKREQEQLDVLATRLQNDLATLALQGVAANQSQASTALTVGQSLLTQIRTSKAVGRLVIDLPRMMRAEVASGTDIVLRGGDQLIVPKYQQEVTVIGEVQNSTSHLYRGELGRDDYISLSGGITRKADRTKIYVVRANGSVVASEGNRWFRRGANIAIKPGDTVVVPLDTERMPALPFWQAVTQIVYNLAISAAAVASFGNN